MTVGSFGSVFATEAENESAVAGMAVNFNNYYASTYTPQEDILQYLMPTVNTETQASAEAQASAAAPTLTVAQPQTEVPTVAARTQGTGTAPDLVADDAAVQETGIVAVLGQLNVRREPSKDAESLGYLYSNCAVSIYDRVSNEEGSWYLVAAGGLEGYVSGDYVKTGEAAKLAEDNINNKIATVVVDGLEAKDSTTDGAQVVETLHIDERYAVMEIQGDYVKLKRDGYAVGYVPLSGVKITTELPEAVNAASVLTSDEMKSIMGDIDYTESVYRQRMADGQYSSAYDAAVYLVEMWNHYIDEAAYAGMDDVAGDAAAKRDSAIELMKQTEPLAAAQNAANAAQTPETQPETQAPAPETPPETQAPAAQTPAETEAPAQSTELPAIVPPTEAVHVIGIEAFYQGAPKTEGEVISADELYIRADYSDGTSQYLYNGAGWVCSDVGMILSGTERVVTIYYDNYSSSFVLPVQPAPTQTQAPETQAPAPETPPETQVPAPEIPPETQAPASTEAPVQSDRDYRSEVVNYALQWVGQCNYVWAGTNLSVGGQVDCSGFTMRVYGNVAGISLPHYSGSQINCGAAISAEQLRPGDLVCYSGHVAIYIGGGQIVHAKSEQAGIVVDSMYFSASQPPIAFRSLLP